MQQESNFDNSDGNRATCAKNRQTQLPTVGSLKYASIHRDLLSFVLGPRCMFTVSKFMKRAYKIRNVMDVCLIDTSTFRNGISVTVVFGIAVCAVPLGIIVSPEGDLQNYLKGFRLLKQVIMESWEAEGIPWKANPTIFMRDEPYELREAVKSTWPGMNHILSSTYVQRNLLQWLEKSKYGITTKYESLALLMELIDAKTPREFDRIYAKFIRGPLSEIENILCYVNNLVLRRQQWSFAFNEELMQKHQDAIRCCDAVMYLIRSFLLTKRHIVRVPALVAFIIEKFSRNIEQQLETIVSGKKTKCRSHFLNFDIKDLGDHLFVLSAGSSSYTIDLRLGICNCGMKKSFAIPCKHQEACAELSFVQYYVKRKRSPEIREWVGLAKTDTELTVVSSEAESVIGTVMFPDAKIAVSESTGSKFSPELKRSDALPNTNVDMIEQGEPTRRLPENQALNNVANLETEFGLEITAEPCKEIAIPSGSTNEAVCSLAVAANPASQTREFLDDMPHPNQCLIQNYSGAQKYFHYSEDLCDFATLVVKELATFRDRDSIGQAKRKIISILKESKLRCLKH